MSTERLESFSMETQKSCRTGKIPRPAAHFRTARHKAPGCGKFVFKNYFRASISLETSFRFSLIERPWGQTSSHFPHSWH